MSEFRADLHCHSTFSDGSLSPRQLVELAVTKELKGLSISDHDTIGAYPEALTAGLELNINVIPGVEFSATDGHHPVHILGYGFDPKADSITQLCAKHHDRRNQRNQAILERLASQGMPLDANDLAIGGAKGSIGRPHIAQAMIRKGYVDTVPNAFKRYLREGGQAYASGPRFSVEETLEAIHGGGGLAVIAHPHLIQNERVTNRLLTLPFDGIEAYYAYFPLDACERWLKIAAQKDWFITGGSDFHGDVKPNISLGSSWTPQDTFDRILAHYRSPVS